MGYYRILYLDKGDISREVTKTIYIEVNSIPEARVKLKNEPIEIIYIVKMLDEDVAYEQSKERFMLF